jgi:predicted alpha/beta hydrolase family esterase
MMQQANLLIVPGRGNSEPGHWQSILEARTPGARRVEQAWHTPVLEKWSRNIDCAVRASAAPPLVVAHSFGCLALAHAQRALGTPVGAALFVAPADPGRFGLPRALFAEALLAPGMLVASENDPWMSLAAARALAEDWGLDCINLGAAGHINLASGYGPWPLGEALVDTLLAELAQSPARALPPLSLRLSIRGVAALGRSPAAGASPCFS